MTTLYYTPGSCALAVRIALEEAQLPYRLERVDFASAQQRSSDYLAINPKGRVPALVTPEGVLTETPALLAYVAQTCPRAQLAPVTPFGLARMQELNSYLASTVHVAHAHRLRASRWADDPEAIAAMQRKVSANMSDCFAYLETHYLQDCWVLGEQFTVSDAYLFTVATWLKNDGVDIAQFPRMQAHHQRMLARPAVQRAMA
ncbi:glutathione S-transferase family protein [Pantoea sp. 18069]|uniref:glutathione S-transferase family protein n=1 Tax=Pantoea sp. 18069 TaxID=2681415 RepID=UPI0013598207|nr:glutathione S-transferase N-terminal domain-containing protein [Pantoea sp. 18069]